MRRHYQQFELSAAVEQQINLPEGRSFELQMDLNWLAGETVSLHFTSDAHCYCSLRLDSLRQTLVLDRSGALSTDGEQIRELAMPDQQAVKLQILLDQSSIEIFINDGEFVMTAVVFTEPGQSGTHADVTAIDALGAHQLLDTCETSGEPLTKPLSIHVPLLPDGGVSTR
ncbi:GH32 C-terminal domain-containing protein [Vibrio sp. PP-XX7]